MRRAISKILLIAGLLLTVEAFACELSLNQATDIALDHLGNHSEEFEQWFNEKSSLIVHDKIERNGFFDEDYELFFFPLLTIRDKYIKGSIWIEVYCDGTSRSRHFLEEV